MRLRAILAMVVAALLLSVPCVASACEVSCGLMAMGSRMPAMASDAGTHTGPSMQMGHCQKTSATPGHTAHFAAAHAASCVHPVCNEQAQPLQAERDSVPAQLTALHAALVVTALVFPPAEPQAASPRSTAPPLRPSLLVSLQTILRV